MSRIEMAVLAQQLSALASVLDQSCVDECDLDEAAARVREAAKVIAEIAKSSIVA